RLCCFQAAESIRVVESSRGVGEGYKQHGVLGAKREKTIRVLGKGKLILDGLGSGRRAKNDLFLVLQNRIRTFQDAKA
ncbi:hypothetical protein N4Q66_26820, partial [Leclercia adecarboxylata]|uniref:hypothetical protein n=1 Tax=Leclercia adecarboxylata TaxID=83655 RepID=UPI00234CC790